MAQVPELFSGIRNAEPHDVVNQVHRLFSQITGMSADEVTAAYQTISFLQLGNCPAEDRARFRHIEEAIILRMKGIVKDTPGFARAVDLRRRFADVTGLGTTPFL